MLTKLLSRETTSGSRPESLSRVRGPELARSLPFDGLRDGRDMRGGRAAAAADYVQQAGARELLEDGGHFLGRLPVAAKLVGKSGVWVRADVEGALGGELGDMRPHL
jgi:hypothetical protein